MRGKRAAVVRSYRFAPGQACALLASARSSVRYHTLADLFCLILPGEHGDGRLVGSWDGSARVAASCLCASQIAGGPGTRLRVRRAPGGLAREGALRYEEGRGPREPTGGARVAGGMGLSRCCINVG